VKPCIPQKAAAVGSVRPAWHVREAHPFSLPPHLLVEIHRGKDSGEDSIGGLSTRLLRSGSYAALRSSSLTDARGFRLLTRLAYEALARVRLTSEAVGSS